MITRKKKKCNNIGEAKDKDKEIIGEMRRRYHQ